VFLRRVALRLARRAHARVCSLLVFLLRQQAHALDAAGIGRAPASASSGAPHTRFGAGRRGSDDAGERRFQHEGASFDEVAVAAGVDSSRRSSRRSRARSRVEAFASGSDRGGGSRRAAVARRSVARSTERQSRAHGRKLRSDCLDFARAINPGRNAVAGQYAPGMEPNRRHPQPAGRLDLLPAVAEEPLRVAAISPSSRQLARR
jgi:hypothetical protein